MLAFLATRVLGQYELFLPPDPTGREPTGRLTLVAPNIVNAEHELNVDPHDFRLWVCLHEETHRVQFTGVSWLREYVRSQMTEFLLASDLDLPTLLDRLRGAADAVADVVRGGEGNLIDAIQTPRAEGDPRPPDRRDDARRGPRRLRDGRGRPVRGPVGGADPGQVRTSAARAAPGSTAPSAACWAST